jgi:hypothetical protein
MDAEVGAREGPALGEGVSEEGVVRAGVIEMRSKEDERCNEGYESQQFDSGKEFEKPTFKHEAMISRCLGGAEG